MTADDAARPVLGRHAAQNDDEPPFEALIDVLKLQAAEAAHHTSKITQRTSENTHRTSRLALIRGVFAVVTAVVTALGAVLVLSGAILSRPKAAGPPTSVPAQALPAPPVQSPPTGPGSGSPSPAADAPTSASTTVTTTGAPAPTAAVAEITRPDHGAPVPMCASFAGTVSGAVGKRAVWLLLHEVGDNNDYYLARRVTTTVRDAGKWESGPLEIGQPSKISKNFDVVLMQTDGARTDEYAELIKDSNDRWLQFEPGEQWLDNILVRVSGAQDCP